MLLFVTGGRGGCRPPVAEHGVDPGAPPQGSKLSDSGPARLILADGACISGMASLSTNQRGGLNGWGGTFRPDEITADLRSADQGLRLELPYDRVGTVALTRIRKLLATQVLMSRSEPLNQRRRPDPEPAPRARC